MWRWAILIGYARQGLDDCYWGWEGVMGNKHVEFYFGAKWWLEEGVVGEGCGGAYIYGKFLYYLIIENTAHRGDKRRFSAWEGGKPDKDNANLIQLFSEGNIERFHLLINDYLLYKKKW